MFEKHRVSDNFAGYIFSCFHGTLTEYNLKIHLYVLHKGKDKKRGPYECFKVKSCITYIQKLAKT